MHDDAAGLPGADHVGLLALSLGRGFGAGAILGSWNEARPQRPTISSARIEAGISGATPGSGAGDVFDDTEAGSCCRSAQENRQRRGDPQIGNRTRIMT